MPKAKRRAAPEPGRRGAEGHPPPKPNLGFLANRWVWRVILVFVIVGLLFLFAPIFIGWGTVVFTLFGLGLVLVIAAAVAAIWLTKGEHFDWLKSRWISFTNKVRYWNVVVGVIILLMAVWGLLSFFRAGMSATVNFQLTARKDVMLLPLNAVRKVGDRSYVFVMQPGKKDPQPLQISTGLENTSHIEVADGLKVGDGVYIPTAKMLESLQRRRFRGPTNPLEKKKE